MEKIEILPLVEQKELENLVLEYFNERKLIKDLHYKQVVPHVYENVRLRTREGISGLGDISIVKDKIVFSPTVGQKCKEDCQAIVEDFLDYLVERNIEII
ncbi:MAG: hypothetical protein QXK37_03945 [Candidatus Woesearchaeota archaeon]